MNRVSIYHIFDHVTIATGKLHAQVTEGICIFETVGHDKSCLNPSVIINIFQVYILSVTSNDLKKS